MESNGFLQIGVNMSKTKEELIEAQFKKDMENVLVALKKAKATLEGNYNGRLEQMIESCKESIEDSESWVMSSWCLNRD